ncbi:MAG TPA: hypothetical protein VLM81_04515 [Peptostreptococcaceae bacterium]|jgi:hypothetical protein|nr:hypothetical protein [Peptostreptococcaceae bacterium]
MGIDKKIINLLSQIHILSFEDVSIAKKFLEYEDYESALKHLCSRIYEERVFISRETYELIKRIAEALDTEPWIWNDLEFLIM